MVSLISGSLSSIMMAMPNDNGLLLMVVLLLKATMLLAGVMLLVTRLRSATAATRHLLWSLAIAGLLLLPMLSLLLPDWQWPILPSESAAITPISTSHNQTGTITTSLTTGWLERAQPLLNRVGLANFSWSRWIFFIWALGFTIVLLRMLAGIIGINWMARRATPVTAPEWQTQLNAAALELSLKQPVRLLKSHDITMPIAWGVLRNTVILPVDADDWASDRRQIVLLHELAHIKRRDCLIQIVAQIVAACYWCNPLVWIALRQLRIEREHACDDMVLEAGARASEYAGHLLELARVLKEVNCSSMAIAVAGRSQLEIRLMAILDPHLCRHGADPFSIGTTALAMALLLLPLASIKPIPQLKEVAKLDTLFQETSDALTSNYRAPLSSVPVDIITEITANKTTKRKLTARRQSNRTRPQICPSEDKRLFSDEELVAENIAQLDMESTLQMLPINERLVPSAPVPPTLLSSLPVPAVARPENLTALKDQAQALSFAFEMNAKERSAKTNKENKESKENKDRRESAKTAAVVTQVCTVALDNIEALMNSLKDDNPQVRKQAALALGVLKDKRALLALNQAMKDGNVTVRRNASRAMGVIILNNLGEGLTQELQRVIEQLPEKIVIRNNQRKREREFTFERSTESSTNRDERSRERKGYDE